MSKANGEPQGECQVVHTTRQVIEKKLLAILDNKPVVAALLAKNDLEMVIEGLTKLGTDRALTFAADLKKLRPALK